MFQSFKVHNPDNLNSSTFLLHFFAGVFTAIFLKHLSYPAVLQDLLTTTFRFFPSHSSSKIFGWMGIMNVSVMDCQALEAG